MEAWHECTICGCGGLARVYHLWVWGAGTSVPLVCGVALSQHCLTATVGTVSLVSPSLCSGLGLRFPVPG